MSYTFYYADAKTEQKYADNFLGLPYMLLNYGDNIYPIYFSKGMDCYLMITKDNVMVIGSDNLRESQQHFLDFLKNNGGL